MKNLKHVLVVFSIIWTFLMIWKLRTSKFSEISPEYDFTFSFWLPSSFYIFYLLFVSGIFIYIFLEYRSIDVKKYDFRTFSLWTSAFLNVAVIFMSFNFSISIVVWAISPILQIGLIILSFMGKQPKITEGRFYPAIFGLLSFFWILVVYPSTD